MPLILLFVYHDLGSPMLNDAQGLWETVRPTLSSILGIVAILPYSVTLHGSKLERWLFGILAIVFGFALLPADMTTCDSAATCTRRATIAMVVAVCSYLIYLIIERQYSQTQHSRAGDHKQTTTILGGPELSDEASELRRRKPALTTQQIFDALDGDPHRTWRRWPRTLLIAAHRSLALATGIGSLVAILMIGCAIAFSTYANKAHLPLTISPSLDQTLLDGGRSISIRALLRECDPDIRWHIDGPAGESAATLGEVSQAGNYFAPFDITKNLDLYVIATPRHHPLERQQVKIQLRRHPEYSKPQRVVGTDPSNKKVKFLIEVVDERYSWIIGSNRIAGVNGAAFIQQMANDGIFNGFGDVLCIGAASREYTSKIREEERANDRAYILGNWVRSALPSGDAGVWALKIGRYDEETRLTPEQTAPERQVVIVGVFPHEPSANILLALRDAFTKKRYDEPILGRYLDRYPESNWELHQLRASRRPTG